jgi:hypothetical protein
METTDRVTRRSTIRMCKVKWGHHSEEEATWERQDLKAKYLKLFAGPTLNLEGKILFKGDWFVTP